MMKIEMPKQVSKIIRTLEEHGFEAFAVGGCVRDSVLGRRPNDWDITTSAMPWQTKKLFKKTVDTGIQHGTVTVLQDGIGYEVTTYRIDGEYEDARHPKEVAFTANLLEDLKRRDFTINAMAYNEAVSYTHLQPDRTFCYRRTARRCRSDWAEDYRRHLRRICTSRRRRFFR